MKPLCTAVSLLLEPHRPSADISLCHAHHSNTVIYPHVHTTDLHKHAQTCTAPTHSRPSSISFTSLSRLFCSLFSQLQIFLMHLFFRFTKSFCYLFCNEGCMIMMPLPRVCFQNDFARGLFIVFTTDPKTEAFIANIKRPAGVAASWVELLKVKARKLPSNSAPSAVSQTHTHKVKKRPVNLIKKYFI